VPHVRSGLSGMGIEVYLSGIKAQSAFSGSASLFEDWSACDIMVGLSRNRCGTRTC